MCRSGFAVIVMPGVPPDTIKACPFEIQRMEARSILSATPGFIAEAGFTHSLSFESAACRSGTWLCFGVLRHGLVSG
jgi:hypothetical protein